MAASGVDVELDMRAASWFRSKSLIKRLACVSLLGVCLRRQAERLSMLLLLEHSLERIYIDWMRRETADYYALMVRD